MKEQIKKFFNKYFYFLKIPNFVPKKFVKKLKKQFTNLFEKRDTLEEDITSKEGALDDLSVNGILNQLEEINNVLNNSNNDLLDLSDKAKDCLEEGVNFIETEITGLLAILSTQEAYDWYGG